MKSITIERAGTTLIVTGDTDSFPLIMKYIRGQGEGSEITAKEAMKSETLKKTRKADLKPRKIFICHECSRPCIGVRGLGVHRRKAHSVISPITQKELNRASGLINV